MRDIIFWAVAGGIAGWLASMVTGISERMGCLLNIAVGVAGAVIGAWVFGKLGLVAPGGFVGTVVIAFVGATLLLAIVRLFTKR